MITIGGCSEIPTTGPLEFCHKLIINEFDTNTKLDNTIFTRNLMNSPNVVEIENSFPLLRKRYQIIEI